VTPLWAKYLTTKPIHHSQKLLEQTDAYSIFSIHVIPNIELERSLLSMREKITVLRPEWLAQKIQTRLRQAIQNYQT
jgi:hypothetical protein